MRIKFRDKEEEYLFLKKVIQRLGVSIYLNEMDKDGNIILLWANDITQEITGYSFEERTQLGQEYYKINYHPDDYKRIKQENFDILNKNKKGASFVYRIKSKTDQWRWIYSKVTGWEHDPLKEVTRALCIGFDITDKIVENQAELDILLKENLRLRNELIIHKLSKTEKQVIGLLAQGKTTKQIAAESHRSYDTINNHKRNIFNKLNIHKLSELIVFAVENGLN